jgi:hypothetical protein
MLRERAVLRINEQKETENALETAEQRRRLYCILDEKFRNKSKEEEQARYNLME